MRVRERIRIESIDFETRLLKLGSIVEIAMRSIGSEAEVKDLEKEGD